MSSVTIAKGQDSMDTPIVIYSVYALMLIAVLIQYYDKDKARTFILDVIIPLLEAICVKYKTPKLLVYIVGLVIRLYKKDC